METLNDLTADRRIRIAPYMPLFVAVVESFPVRAGQGEAALPPHGRPPRRAAHPKYLQNGSAIILFRLGNSPLV